MLFLSNGRAFLLLAAISIFPVRIACSTWPAKNPEKQCAKFTGAEKKFSWDGFRA